MNKIKGTPEGLHTITPVLTVDGAAEAIAFYAKAFGAEEVHRAADPSGTKVWHAKLKIGDSHLFINDCFEQMGQRASGGQLWLYVDNVDAAFKRAVEAGAQTIMAPEDMFWGDRFCKVSDRFGVSWSLAQQVKVMTPDELKRAQDAFVAKMGQNRK